MNALIIGTTDKTQSFIDLAPTTGFLLVHDDFEFPFACDLLDTSNRFNILRAATDHDRFARDFIAILDSVFPYGATTLTRGTENYLLLNILRLLLLDKRATLLDIPRVLDGSSYRADLLSLNKDPVVADNWAFINGWDAKDYRPLIQKISGVLASPIIREVMCAQKTTFKINAKRRTVLKLDRAAIGDFAAFLIGSLLIGNYSGQLVIPDFGFFGRDLHTNIIRQDRLIAGVNFLQELPVRLQQTVLGMRHKTAYRTTAEDADRLLPYFIRKTKPSDFTHQSETEFITT